MEPINAEDGTMIGVRFIPFFPASRATVGFAYGTATTIRGQVTDQLWLTVSGVRGRMHFRHCNESAVPAIDASDKPAAPPEHPIKRGGKDA